MAARWDVESMNLWEIDGLGITEERRGIGRFLVPDVGDSLKEEKRENVRLPVGPVHGGTAEDLCAFPKV